MNVEQIMSRAPMSCGMGDTLDLAARIMWDHDCGIVPVVDAEGKPIGMITDRDICFAVTSQSRLPSEISISTVASKEIVSVRASDAVQIAEDKMKQHRIRRVAVTDDDGKLVGLLSLNDLARHAGHRSDDLTTDEVTRTLAAICTPRRRVAHAA